MENEIQNAASVSQINSILSEYAGQYDLDITMLAKSGIGIGVTKGIHETPMIGAGTVHQHTGRDVYRVQSSKDLTEVKDLVIKSIKYRS
jgi:hypothetical protein